MQQKKTPLFFSVVSRKGSILFLVSVKLLISRSREKYFCDKSDVLYALKLFIEFGQLVEMIHKGITKITYPEEL